MCYLDNSATTPLCPQAVEAMEACLRAQFGNPSSLHRLGVEAQGVLDRARAAIAARMGCTPAEIYFTSGGTESNNTALFGAAQAKRRRGNRIVVTAVEHASVLGPAQELERRGFEVVRLPVQADGSVSEEEAAAAVTADTVLVSIMLVNNETGAIQPVQAAAKAVRAAGADALVHCDAVQAFGKLDVRPALLGADLVTISSHKIHGPKGAGALYVRRGVHLPPLMFGGGQERELRPGTEATPALAGFGAAVEALPDPAAAREHAAVLRGRCVEALRALGGVEVNSPEDGLPYILNVSVPGVRSETMLHFLEQREIYVSSGSACAKGAASHVLRAQGLSPARADSALRISFSRMNTEEDVDRLCEGIRDGMSRLRRARR